MYVNKIRKREHDLRPRKAMVLRSCRQHLARRKNFVIYYEEGDFETVYLRNEADAENVIPKMFAANEARLLGMIYLKGDKVPQNYREALKWFIYGAKLGSGTCREHEEDIYRSGEGFDLESKRARAFFNRMKEESDREEKHRKERELEKQRRVLWYKMPLFRFLFLSRLRQLWGQDFERNFAFMKQEYRGRGRRLWISFFLKDSFEDNFRRHYLSLMSAVLTEETREACKICLFFDNEFRRIVHLMIQMQRANGEKND